MTIRYLAQELYRLTKKVAELEQTLAAFDGSAEDRARLEAELFKARKDRDHCRAVLEAKKEKPLI